MRSINEEGTILFRLKFYDENGSQYTPTSLSYRLDCLSTGSKITEWTTLTPAEEVTLVLTGSQNRIINQQNSREIRQAVVKYTDLLGYEQTSQQQFKVVNLGGVT